MEDLSNFTPDRLRVLAPAPAARNQNTKPRYRRVLKAEFMPEVPWALFCRMAALPGKAGWVGLAIYRLTRMRRSMSVMVNCSDLAVQIGVNVKAVYNGLTALESAGVIETKRGRGSFATVVLLINPEPQPATVPSGCGQTT